MTQPQQLNGAPAQAVELEKPSLLDQIVADAAMRQEADAYRAAWDIGKLQAKSGMFPNADTPEKAAVLIMYGRELGISPITALQSLHIVKGKLGIDGQLIGALLRREGYDWQIATLSATECTLIPLFGGQPILDDKGQPHRITWTLADAEKAGLTEKKDSKGATVGESMYTKYGSDMLFWRCITRLQRRFAPEVTKGMKVYTQDETDEMAAQAMSEAETIGAATEKRAANLKARLEMAKS